MILLFTAIFLTILKAVAPDKYKKVTKRCRKKVIELSEDNGRGPIGDQLRAILADYGSTKDVFAMWDRDGGGEVSRKEFRLWWPKIGYDAPTAAIDDLFDEFDVDGSGEIDEEEFRTAFAAKGELWKELNDLQRQNDESEAIHKAIVELEGKITKSMKKRSSEAATQKRLAEKMEIKGPAVAKTQEELASLTQSLSEHQARLDKFAGGIKEMMKQAKVVNVFKSLLTPDEAAVAIQSRVRGRTAKREVLAKKQAAEDNNPRKALLARTAAFIQEREINRRMQLLREGVQVLGVAEALSAFRSGPPSVLPYHTQQQQP